MASIDKALPKPGIELYSGKYFAACGLGGIIGTFPLPLSHQPI
jgi:solute carrier family 25 phosphate transporter 3